MGLATIILASLYLFPSRLLNQTTQADPEKGSHNLQEQSTTQETPRVQVEETSSDQGLDEADTTADATDDENDTYTIQGTQGRHQAQVQRDHHFPSFPSLPSRARLSRPFTHTNTTDTTSTSFSTVSAFSKVKSFLFPHEDPDGLDRFVPNYRWTPIISGVLIPFSILLEIPGLTEHWYIRTEGKTIVETKPNPPILNVGVAISIACAVIANICLILRFLEKRVRTNTLLCIIFLTLHDIINIVIVTTFGIEHRFDDGFTYGQSFWMTVCSTAASTITNITLIVDFVRTPNFDSSGSGLTPRQRSLVIIVMTLFIYIAFGALCNTFLDDINFIDGLYFTIAIIETIGFGDIAPHTAGARVFTCVYVVVGIVNLGIVIAMCRETVLEGLEVGYRQRLRKLRLRRREARRYRRWEERWKKAVEWRLKERGLPVWIQDHHSDHEGIRSVGLHGPTNGVRGTRWLKKWAENIGLAKERPAESIRHVKGHPKGKHLNIDALSSAQLEAAAIEAGVPLEMITEPANGRPSTDSHNCGNGQHCGGPSLGTGHASLNVDRGLYRTPSSNVWPSHPQTPTHAQVGRMAAMVTKFAVASTGTHLPDIEHGFESTSDPREDVQARTQINEKVEATGGDSEASQTERRKTGGTVWFDERNLKTQEQGNANGNAEGAQNGHAEADGDANTVQARDHVSRGNSGDRPSNGPLIDVGLHSSAPKWARELARGVHDKSSVSYEHYKKDMEIEEKRAYFVKLSVAWSLFLVFWMIGSAIFSATEGWTYAISMYFCFVSFTTLGFGDFTLTTPTGRAIFVVWAMLGVGTMTILISVLQEAWSSKYKSALHSRAFDNAVKKYRQRENEETNRISHERLFSNTGTGTDRGAQRSPHPTSSSPNDVTPEVVDEAREHAQRELESLPSEILRETRMFHEHMQFYANRGHSGGSFSGDETKSGTPRELKSILDDICHFEHIGERAKTEILQDEDARKTLFTLSVERILRSMINSAEKSLAALAERDGLIALMQQRHYLQNNVEETNRDEEGESHRSRFLTRASTRFTSYTSLPSPSQATIRSPTTQFPGRSESPARSRAQSPAQSQEHTPSRSLPSRTRSLPLDT